MLVCPKCKEELHRSERSHSCLNRHSYDISKEGYVNLLLSQKSIPEEWGDSKPMLLARREILESGRFASLSNHLCDMVERLALSRYSKQGLHLLDVGCGEGFYLGEVIKRLEKDSARDGGEISFFGTDISKDALKMAAKRYPAGTFFLSNVHEQIPIKDGSISIITVTFAPRNFEEFGRILSPDGICIVTIPSPDHLKELRSYVDLLEVEADKESKLASQAKGFRLLESSATGASVELERSEMVKLLTMTPNFRHSSEDEWAAQLPQRLRVTLSLKVNSFCRA